MTSATQHWNTVAIVGVGLIGGSIGLGLRQRGLANEVIGIGRSAVSLRVARRVGAVTRATTDLRRGVAQAELVVVCTPVACIAQHVQQAAAAARCAPLITDAGSTKASIVRQVDGQLPGGARFVGSHPLAGSEKTGPGEARADLFVDRITIVTPTRHTRRADVSQIESLWRALGSRVVRMPADEHDEVLARTSHMPHALAAALAASIPRSDWRWSGGGLRDTTRIAAADPDLWAQILLDNRHSVLQAMECFDAQWRQLREALHCGDEVRLRALLARARRNRDALGS
jgi:prephenate dehydrogenase